MKKYALGLLALVVLSSFSLVGYIYYAGSANKQRQLSVPTIDNENNWQNWQHDTIGLKFKYPKAWGKVITNPSEYITDLTTINEKYKGDNFYADKIAISFSSSSVVINLYDAKAIYADKYVSDDNFEELKNHQNICQYQIANSWPETKEVFSDCKNQVKTVVIKKKDNYVSLGDLNQYELKEFGFRKLQNGYFDNALAINSIGFTAQTKSDAINLDNFFEFIQSSTTKQEYIDQSRQFSQFVNSFESYAPVEKNKSDLIVGADPDENTIRQFYYNIYTGKLAEAFGMIQNSDMTLEKFNDFYKNIFEIKPRNFEKIDDKKYRLFVDSQNHNQKPKVFRIEMTVAGDKITPLTTEEITSPMAQYNNYSAFTKAIDKVNYVVLADNGKEKNIDQAFTDFDTNNVRDVQIFNEPKFSQTGKYLTYKAGGWEWFFIKIHFISNNENKNHSLNSPFYYGFSHNDKYFYACADNEMLDVKYVRIYSLPDFKVIKDFDLAIKKNDFIDSYHNLNCQFNEQENKIKAEVICNNPNHCQNQIIEYDFDDLK